METQLRAAREVRGWSQLRLVAELQRVASHRGLAVPARASLKTEVSRWENGHVQPREPYVSLLADVYDTTPAELGLASVSLPAMPAQLGGGIRPGRLSPESVLLIDELLASYTKTDNVLGPRHLLHVASQHVMHLEPLLVRVRGPLRAEALRLASRFGSPAGCRRTPEISPRLSTGPTVPQTSLRRRPTRSSARTS